MSLISDQLEILLSVYSTLCICVATMPRRDACDHTAHTSAICIFLGHSGTAVRTLLWCDMVLRIAC